MNKIHIRYDNFNISRNAPIEVIRKEHDAWVFEKEYAPKNNMSKMIWREIIKKLLLAQKRTTGSKW
jgi:hypothetical protein